ncbi:MAG: UDP-N-acetylmuramate--L-alanine ligase [Treponema sp.]|jgi:UDP-N-acetylmuramate--alanine ligase|nr:UDP-N-acetylmuramate--L-alanine ligase [Treponema sp.]
MDFIKIFHAGAKVHCVGIKGTGVSAFAEILRSAGVSVTGSDIGDTFYTDAILKEIGVPYLENFDARRITPNLNAVVYSAAYSPDVNPELMEAKRLGVPILKYTDALGEYSKLFDSSGIAGVHGKTTTAAMSGVLLRGAGLPAQILVGSAVSDFGGRSTLSVVNNPAYFVAETCEYRKHFLSFHPNRIVLTSVESDHQDFFPTYMDIRDAFVEYVGKLSETTPYRETASPGELIYCADDDGASEVAEIVRKSGKKIKFTPYGFSAQGDFHIKAHKIENERQIFSLEGFAEPFSLRIAGKHSVLDATAALALVSSIAKAESAAVNGKVWDAGRLARARAALEDFHGSKRRTEIIGEVDGVLFMDDYGHHPTAIKTTLEGLRAFYPNRRLVASFMSHTYTRTAALLEQFAESFASADVVILHKIYASARERYTGGVTGKTLFERVKALHPVVYYVEKPLDAVPLLEEILHPGDLFLTIGAGDNWKLGQAVMEKALAAEKRRG